METSDKLPEFELSFINSHLSDFYGKTEDKPNFRIVFSEDELERRITEYDDKGNHLLMPEVRLLPKYKQWIREKYVLERLTVVPNFSDLTERLSYEPIWVFEDRQGKYLRPKWSAANFIIENLLAAMSMGGSVRYKDPESNPKEAEEAKRERIIKLEKELFGNETDLGDALAHKTGITVPGLKGSNDGNDAKS